MKNSSKINLNEIRESRIREVLLAVNDSCLELKIDFYIIGALARDVWFTEEKIPAIGTKDVDFAVFISEPTQFSKLKKLLVDKHHFTTNENNFFLRAPNKIEIDILPFGQLEVEDGEIIINEDGLNGFKEVYRGSIKDVYVLENKEFKVATLPAIILLKLIAYDDRPEQRGNDPIDCMSIITNYFALENELIYEHHANLFGDLPFELIPSRVIGREMKKALDQNEKLKERVIRILQNHIELKEKSSFVLKMATNVYVATEDCVLYLKEILNGILDDIK